MGDHGAFSGKINLKGGIMASESTNGENTQTTTQESQEQTEKEQIPFVSRKQIGIRLLYTILFLVILGIVLIIVKVVVVFQFIYFFSTREPNESVRQFSNKISTYGYRIFRYITLNESQRPFPFTDFPPELEPSEEQITFD
jgi:membrane peptidoglycan carboxypeptidase